MFWKKGKAGASTDLLQSMPQAPEVVVSSPDKTHAGQDLQDIDQHDQSEKLAPPPARGSLKEKPSSVPAISRPKNSCDSAQRRFFCSNNISISRTRNVTIQGKTEGPRYRPLPDMAAHIPEKTSGFKLIAKFSNYSAGHYNVSWRVKSLQDFNMPCGLHFVVNVSYDEEPDISGTLDVVLPEHKLNLLAKDRWYNLKLEEQLVIQHHVGVARVEVILCNQQENLDRKEYFGFVIEHVEIRPVTSTAESQAGISDFAVPRSAVPGFSIDTTRLQPSAQDTSYVPAQAPVTRLAYSKSGRFLASLALDQNAAYITVWDMSVIRNPSNPYRNAVNKLYRNSAMAVVKHPGIGDLTIGLSFSASGDQVAVYQEPKIGQWAAENEVEKASFPFKLFNNPLVPQPSVVLNMDIPPTNEDEKAATVSGGSPSSRGKNSSYNTADASPSPAEPAELQEVHLDNELLHTFIGYTQFLPETIKSDWEKNDVNSALTSAAETEGDEDGDDVKKTGSKSNMSQSCSLFVTCNGLYLDVFEISSEKKWKRIHTITLKDLLPTLSRRITCKMMMETITSNTFMWLEDSGRSCTIWNLLTGSNITHISSIENARFKGSTFRGHCKMAISPHESIVALASVDGSLTTYFANTGMAIDDRKFPEYKIEHVGFHAQDDQLFVILRHSATFKLKAVILDTLQLKSEIPVNDVPIPTVGSTILSFFNTKGFWNRGLIFEADGTKINCYVTHQPASSKLNKSNESVMKAEPDDVVFESKVKGEDNIQYRLLTGIHRELLPEGDGLSYWVLRVEVVQENLELKTSKVIFSFVPEPWMRVMTSEVTHPENLQSAFFLPDGTRFAVVGMQTLQVWYLPTSDSSKCSLQLMWSQPRDEKDPEFGGTNKSGRVRDYYLDTASTWIFVDLETGITVAEIKMNEKARRKAVSIPGVQNVGARTAILHCFRSIHLLAAAYAFSNRESKKTTRDAPQVTFTYEDHAEAILRFTREHINRMMSVGVYSPKRREASPFTGDNKTNNSSSNDVLESKGPSRSNTQRPGALALETIQPIPDADNAKSNALDSVAVGDNVTIHANANRHDDDEGDEQRLHHGRAKNESSGRQPGGSSTSRPDVVTLLTLLLDHPYLQGTNHVFVEGLLSSGNGDWIPRDNKALNPIKRAIEARNGALVEAFIDYCIKNAKKYHPAYLMPAVQCLNELSDRYPSILSDMFRKASYVPAHNHAYVSSHAIIANPQYSAWLMNKFMFWNWFTSKTWEKSNTINDYKKPVFSLRSQLPFRASSLFNILSVETSIRETRGEHFPPKRDVMAEEERQMQSAFSHKIYVSPFPKLSMYGPYRPWFKDNQSAKSAFTDIAGQDFFDSPAMVATLEFKWHKFGFFYWLMRFLVVITFFILIVTITAEQISVSTSLNPENIQSRYLPSWRPVFKGAIGVGFLLIGYECMQFLYSPKKYVTSPYNYMDLAAYVAPVIGCFLFLRDKPTDDGPDQIWVISFAILALYINILFELRVIRQLGIVVNIILNITRRIVWFFLIFGLFLVSFTHALLHLLHTRKYDPECIAGPCEKDYPDGYPTGFFKALSATYFFLAGRYDPVSSSFENGDTSFHIMMVIFFFFTAILLLNILIALMNDAFNESKNQGQLAWLKQWSEVIAEVEIFMMTQSTRQNRNYFPDYIYYGANEQEAEMYESKYYITNKSNLSIENRFVIDTVSVEQSATQLTQRAILRDIQTFGGDIDKMKKTQDGFNQDMIKLTELMAVFLAQMTTSPISDSEPMSQDSPVSVENDPPTSGKSPTTASEISIPGGPGGTAGPSGRAEMPGGVMRTSASAAAAVAQRRSGSNTKQTAPWPTPAAMRRKVSATALDTESPTTYSPTVHFNSPQSSRDEALGRASSHYKPMPSAYSESVEEESSSSAAPQLPTPYRTGELPDDDGMALRGKNSQSSLKHRLQQKLAVVHTMDDALRSQHHPLEENNASHPMYVKPLSRRDPDEDPMYSSDDDDEGARKAKAIIPVHHSTYYSTSSSSTTARHEEQQYQYQQQHLETQDHPRRTQSDVVVPTVPHESVPLHVHPPHVPPQDSSAGDHNPQ